MSEVMARSERMGLVAASIWASVMVAGGWLTIRLASKAPPSR
jgi:hypothetical protein